MPAYFALEPRTAWSAVMRCLAGQRPGAPSAARRGSRPLEHIEVHPAGRPVVGSYLMPRSMCSVLAEVARRAEVLALELV